jgi:glycosyltransferase involved in cell wall biosynthesis
VRIVVLSPYLPHRRVGHGGGTAVRGLVRHLARRHDVTLLSLLRPGESGLVAEVAELGAVVVGLPFAARGARGRRRFGLLAERSRALASTFRTGYPFYVTKYWSPSLSRQVLSEVAARRPDAIQIEYLQLALLCRDLRGWRDGLPRILDRARPRIVLNTHELGSLPRRRRAAAARPAARWTLGREAAAWERLQRDATGWADVTLCVTEQDRQLLAAQGGRNLRTVPLGMDLEALPVVWQPRDPPRVLFVGSFEHRPNRTAASFLVDKVWPQIAQYDPELQLVLAGRGSGAFLRGHGGRDGRVVALGFVADLTALYRECRLFLAPLAEGGGIKIKILEALARGIPVVTTPIGSEGIVDADQEAVFLARPDETFAATVLRALGSPEEAGRRAARARRIIEDRFSWEKIVDELALIYEGG